MNLFKNEFNTTNFNCHYTGYYIVIKMTNSLLNKISSLLSVDRNYIKLIPYNQNHKLLKDFLKNDFDPEANKDILKYTNVSDNFAYLLPFGIFSNLDMDLIPGNNSGVQDLYFNCEFLKTERNFIFPSKNMSDLDLSEFNLFPKQQRIITKIDEELKKYDKKKYITIVAPCGLGKTITTLYYILSRIKCKTFIITQSLALCEQWEKEINGKFKGLKVLNSKNGVTKLMNNPELYNCDILIFPDKHLTKTKFIHTLSNNFSVCVVDEQHKYNLTSEATTMKTFLTITSFQYIFSLTATPVKYNKMYFGREITFAHKDFLDLENQKEIRNAFRISLVENENENDINKKKDIDNDNLWYNFLMNTSKLKTDNMKNNFRYATYRDLLISQDKKRIELIVSTIILSLNLKNKKTNIINPKVLILTKYVKEIEEISSRLKIKLEEEDIDIFPLYAGNEDERKRVFEDVKKLDKFIMIGTQDYFGTGIDIPDLNILHLTSLNQNKVSLKQALGRVERKNDSIEKEFYYYTYCTFTDYQNKNLNVISVSNGRNFKTSFINQLRSFETNLKEKKDWIINLKSLKSIKA